MNRPYDLIVFDLGNTLIRFDHRIAADKIVQRFDVDGDALYDAMFDSELTREFGTGKISPNDFHARFSALYGVRLGFGEFSRIWSDIFWEDEEACRLAKRLRGKVPLCLMSNIDEIHYAHIRKRFDVIGIFDHFILSYEVGALKPDRRIYESARDASKVPFSRMLYIDDRQELVDAAASYGIESVRFEGARKLEELFLKKKVL